MMEKRLSVSLLLLEQAHPALNILSATAHCSEDDFYLVEIRFERGSI
jgi:hypothetical protein